MNNFYVAQEVLRLEVFELWKVSIPQNVSDSSSTPKWPFYDDALLRFPNESADLLTLLTCVACDSMTAQQICEQFAQMSQCSFSLPLAESFASITASPRWEATKEGFADGIFFFQHTPGIS